MNLRDFIGIAAGNLWRLKLRTSLTILGVVIGIGALVSMLSFAFGVQRNVSAEFEKIGLFRTIQVLPMAAPADSSVRVRPLDDAAMAEIADLEGVRLVYPQQSFDAEVTWPGHEHRTLVQALPASFMRERSLGQQVTGRTFLADSAHEAVVSMRWLRDQKMTPDSVMGRTFRVKGASVSEIGFLMARRYLDGLGVPRELLAVAGQIARFALSAFEPGPIDVTVVGVTEVGDGFGFRLGDIIIPSGIARGRDYLSFSDPLELMAMLEEPPESGWPMLVVTLADERVYEKVKSQIEEKGYRATGFLDRFQEMRKGFLVFDAMAAVIGLIALFVAALGIANTMVMSIVERTREIGILKSLGAEDRHVRLMFLVESGTIGLIGGTGGLLLGWLVSRIASFAARRWMENQQMPQFDMFHLPVWAGFAAVAFGIGLSVIAGLYPASRAARVDPVEALRHD